jgi:hypothetical protein
MSKVFYNDGKRFAAPRIGEIPTAGSHWTDIHDMGHVRDRSWRQTYESSVFTWTSSAKNATIAAEAEVPQGCSLKLEARAAATAGELESAQWTPVNGEAIELAPAARAMQYRAVFVSDNGDRYPVLQRVRVSVGDRR